MNGWMDVGMGMSRNMTCGVMIYKGGSGEWGNGLLLTYDTTSTIVVLLLLWLLLLIDVCHLVVGTTMIVMMMIVLTCNGTSTSLVTMVRMSMGNVQ